MKTIDFADNPPAVVELSFKALKQMWIHLQPEARMPTERDTLIRGIEQALHDGDRIRAIFETASETEQLALRIAYDAKDSGFSLRLLQLEMARFTGANCEITLLGLFAKGMLLASRSQFQRWQHDNKTSFDEHNLCTSILSLHPHITAFVRKITVPGESRSLRILQQPLDHAKLTLSVTPDGVINNLLAVCRTVDRHPLLMTTRGDLRAGAIKEMASISDLDEHDFFTWANLARLLLVVEVDEDGHWSRSLLAPRLINEPLIVLSLLPVTLQTYPYTVSNFGVHGAYPFKTPGYHYAEGSSSLKSDLVQIILTALTASSATFPKPAHWFSDDDMASRLRLTVRKWAYGEAQQRYPYMQAKTDVSYAMDSLRGFVNGALNTFAKFGLIDRFRHGERRFSRLTRIGAWAFRFGKAFIEDTSTIPGLEGTFSWNKKQIELTHRPDAAIVGLALGMLGEQSSEGTFQINGVTALRAAEAGLPPAAIFERIDRLVPGGAPDSVKQEITEALRQFQPVVIKPNISVISLIDMDDNRIKELSKLGSRIGDFIMLDPVEEAQFEAWARPIRTIDYDKPPQPSCTLTHELDLSCKKGIPHDLRLRQLLEDLGLKADNEKGELRTQLDPSRIPGLLSLSEKVAARRLTMLSAALAPHLIDGFSEAASIRLKALAGLAEAPSLEEYIVLIFPPEEARGLMQLKVLGKKVEPLSNGRLLVPRRVLPSVEEALSELGIPFPAEHSTLLESGRTRVAVERLEEAASAFDPSSDR